MGVRLVNLGDGQSLVAIARNAEASAAAEVGADADDETTPGGDEDAAGPAGLDELAESADEAELGDGPDPGDGPDLGAGDPEGSEDSE